MKRYLFKTLLGVLFALFLFFSLLAFPEKTLAATYYVADDIGDDTRTTVQAQVTTTPWKTIQKAADNTAVGDTVNVKGGLTYTSPSGGTLCNTGSPSDKAVVCETTDGTSGSPITYQAWAGTGTPIIDAGVASVDTSMGFGIASGADYIIIDGFEIINGGENSETNAGGIRLLGSKGSILRNNIIHDIKENAMGINIFLGGASGGVKAYNNTIYNAYYGIAVTSATNADVKNNIIFDSKTGGSGIICSSATTPTFSNNLVWNNTTNYSGCAAGTDDINSDPLLTDPANGDFTLQMTSPAINAGNTIASVTTDIIGHSRPKAGAYDIGAYEDTNFYVAGDTGDDTTGNGSSTLPWKTIQKAADTMIAGDTVNVKGGLTYTGSDSCLYNSVVCIDTNSGSASNPITYQAWAGTGTPIISLTGSNASGISVISKNHITISGFRVDMGEGATLRYGMYTQVTQNVILKNNLLVIFGSGTLVGGIKSYSGVNDMIINNNFYERESSTVTWGASIIYSGVGTANATAKNNIISNIYFAINADSETIGANVTADYNLYYGNDTGIDNNITLGDHMILNQDPLFVDAENSNFALESTSPAINVGATLSEVTTDIVGVTRPQGAGYDIGAYEYYDIPVTLSALSPDPNSSNIPTFTGTASTIGAGSISSISYSIDSGSWTASGVTGTSNFTIAIPSALTDGSHSLRVRATDSYTNTSDSSLYGTDSFTIDATSPVNPGNDSPSGYIKDDTRPTLIFFKTTDATSGISSYSVSLDSGKNKSYSTSGIPISATGIWKDNDDVKVEFLSDNKISVYFKGLNSSDLIEGKHSWSVTAYDNVGNSAVSSTDFYLDRTTPSISEPTIADVSTVTSGVSYNLNITNRMPSFSGLATDIYQGLSVTNSNGTKDTFDKVSSGPKILSLILKRLKDGESSKSDNPTYVDYLSKDFILSDITDLANDKKTARFFITTPFPLVDGYYKVQLSLKDGAGNTYDQPDFYISLNSSQLTTLKTILTGQNLETEITKQETTAAETEEEKQEGYTVKIKVVDTENNPVKDAKVTIHSEIQETTTDENGIATFNNVEPGDHRVLIAYDNYKGEQKINLTGEVKEFSFDITVKQQNPLVAPQVIAVVGGFLIVIIVLVVLLVKARSKRR